MFNFMIKEKTFYRTLIAFAIPVILQNLLGTALNMMDTIMLGGMGEVAISAAALGNQPFFIFMLFTFGVSGGMGVLICQYWGKKDMNTINSVVGMALIASMVISALFTVVAVAIPETILTIFTKDTEVIRYGAEYLRIVACSYFFYAITTTFANALRNMEKVRIPVAINAGALIANTILNYLLINGVLGFPRLGVAGAAWATLISRVLECAAILLYVLVLEKEIQLQLRRMFRFSRLLFSDFMRYSLPVIFNESLWGIGTSVHASIMGHIGAEATAAFNVADIVQRLALAVCFGLSSAALIFVGKELGQGNLERAKKTASTILGISLIYSVLGSLLILALRPIVLMFFNLEPNTITICNEIMLVMALILAFKAFNSPNIVGVLRAGGDTRFSLFIDVGFLWTVTIPLGAVVGLVWGAPVWVVYLCLMSDEFIKFFIGIWRFRSGRWIRNITRDFGVPPENLQIMD